MSSKKRKAFSEAVKMAAVKDVKAGMKYADAARKHGVSTPSMIGRWVKNVENCGTPDCRKLKAKSGEVVAVTVPANPLAKVDQRNGSRDAIVFLRKGKSELMRGIREGTINDLDNVHLLALLALRSLTE